MSVEKNKLYKYFLHYIGKGLYDKEDFIIEAEQIGVNRAFPSFMLKKMNFGDRILLAQYESGKQEDGKALETSKAVVFGYFVVSGLNFDCQNKAEFLERLVSQLKVVSIGKEQNKVVKRKCGSYTIGSVYYVKDSLPDIIDKAVKIAEELQIKTKTFAGGSFHQMTLKTISPVPFTRTGFYVELNKNLESEKIRFSKIGFIGNYQQKKYYLKAEKKL